jgi:hypothetical protein
VETNDLLKAVKDHGSLRSAAAALGIPESTLRGRIRGAVPLSENQRKYQADWTADDCIAELQRIAKIDEDKVITRNHFRVHSEISESTWSRHFGSFLEFKRQAGIILSRHAHQLERSIAKHASKDAQREINVEKRQWEDRYLRPSSKRFQTVLVGSDLHDTDCDPFWRHCFIETAKRVRPEKIVLNGDCLDLPEFSRYTQDPREWDVIGRIKWLHQFLRDLREASPDSEIVYIAGNHEERLLIHLSEATPALKVVLSDLHGFTVSKLLGLEEFGINFVSRADLSAFTAHDIKKELRKNYHILYDCLLAHHFPEGRAMGLPGWNGHHHKYQSWPFYSPMFGSTQWMQLGCGHQQAATYCAGEKWSLGFLLAHVDTQTKHSQFEYVELRDHAMIGGRFYERSPAEQMGV